MQNMKSRRGILMSFPLGLRKPHDKPDLIVKDDLMFDLLLLGQMQHILQVL